VTAAVLLDSDVLIEVLRNRNAEIEERWYDLVSGDSMLAYSAVTAAEIWHGAFPQEEHRIREMFSVLTCIPVDEQVGRRAGEYLRRFHRSHGLQLGDALIAATASTHELTFWTRNRKHYRMLGLRLH
jgi:predicted nucleic acid-binding protein